MYNIYICVYNIYIYIYYVYTVSVLHIYMIYKLNNSQIEPSSTRHLGLRAPGRGIAEQSSGMQRRHASAAKKPWNN